MRGMSKKDALACQVSLGLFAGLLGIASTAHGAPIADGGGANHDGVRAGGATINQSGTTTNITGGPNNVIGWKDFSVKNGESVVFDGGANTNNYLNVVTGKVTSRIDGSITGGNNVYIANTNGVVFGESASVNVGNLYVTTRAVDVDAIGRAVAGGATLASQESSIINTTAAAAPNTAKAEIVSLVDGTGHSVAANKIVLEGQSVRILNSANITATTDVQISVSEAQKKFQKKVGGTVTTEGTRDNGYIHVGSTTGGTAPTSYHGNLAVEGFKLVSTPQELEDMKNDLAGKYMLKNDIDLSSTTHTPIGDHNAAFTGKFDGMFHEVKNMTLGAGTAADHVGLFGNINGAVVMNVGIKNANLSSLDYGGAVVGKAENSHIFNVYNESTSMIGSTGSSATNAGGVVGWLKNSTLDTAYNTSDVGKQAGGLVGNLDYSQIMDAYNTGAVQFNTGTNNNESWGGYATGQGTTSIVHNVYLKNNGAAAAGGNDLSMSVQGSYQIDGANKNKLLQGTDEKDAFSATSYSTWDIAADGGENKTWRIFDGHSLPLLTAFMQGAVQAEYAYADFQQAGHAHSGDTASTYTVQAADKQTDGSYVTRAGKESNDGESISRVYNADYLKIAKKNNDGSYSAITNVNDADLKLYGADDRSLVHLSQGTAGGGRRNAGSNAAYDGVDGKGGREAMLYGGQHGYDIAGANVTIGKRKVIGSVNNMGKIEREYDGTADASAQFANAIKTGNVSLRTDGLVDGDGAAVSFNNNNAVTFRQAWTATSAKSPDVGYDKPVYVDGSLVQFTGGEENYEFDASAINALNLKGNVTQRTITATLNPATGINKVYDGDVDVKGAAYIPTATNNVLTLTNTVGSDTAANLLDYTDIKGKYRTGDSNANPGTETKQAGAHGVAYSGIKLTGANKHNYKLVDGNGNILYREAVTGELAAMAGDVVTSGTIWGKGEIERRNIRADTFLWDGIGTVSKVYDGTTEFDNAENKTITAKKAGTGVNPNEGLIAGDAAKVKFEIVGKGEFRKTDGSTPTANVAEAAKAAYKLTATNTTGEDVLSNYKIGGEDAVSGGKYDVTSEGKITPRVIDVQLLKAAGIDKTYDGTVDAIEGDDGHKYLTMGKTWVGYAGTGKLVGDTNDSGVGTDGAKIKVTATYRQHGTTTDDKNVVRAADKSVIENGKDVYYTFKLEGGNAATNYTFNADGITPQAEKYATGTGKITPKKLTATIGTVTRGYNGTSDLDVSRVALVHPTLSDKVGTDDVSLNTGSDSTIRGTYYKTSAKSEKAVNRGTGYTVAYTGLSSALVGTDSGNYWIDDVYDGLGDITKAFLTAANFHMNLHSKVQKRYDMTNQAFSDGLKNVTLDGTQLREGQYTFDQDGSRYYNTGPTGLQAPNSNVAEDGATMHNVSGTQAYGVEYTIDLQGSSADSVANNYDLTGLNGQTYDGGTYSVNGTKISYKKAGVGYILPRRLYVSLGGAAKSRPTKVYDGTTKLKIDGAQEGDVLVSMGNGGDPDAGFAANPRDVENKSTGEYESRDAGKKGEEYSRKVVYTPKVSGIETNYVFYHAPQQEDAPTNPYAGKKWDRVTAPLLGEGTITPAEMRIKTPTDVRRQYNGDVDVATGQGRLALDLAATPRKKKTVGGVEQDDDVDLNHIAEKPDGSDATDKYYRYYNEKDANVDDTAANKNKYVTYRRIQLTGADAGNYKLVYKDAAGENADLDKDTMTDPHGNPYYTMKGYGLIEKRKVTGDNFNIGLKTGAVEKTYDGNKWVQGHDGKGFVSGKTASQNPTLWKNLVTKSYVKDGTKEIDIGIASVNEAEYRATDNTGNAGTRAKDAGSGKKVRLNVTFDPADLKNFDLSDLRNAAANEGAWQADGSYDYYKITDGKINPKELRVDADAYARKVYDGTSKVKDIENHLHLHDEDVVKEGTDGDDVKLVYGSGKSEGLYKQGGADVSKANIDPFAAAAKGYDVEYTVSFEGKDKGNYVFKHGGTAVADGGKITAKGDIERRMVFADLVNPTLKKYYDGTKDAKRYSSAANANEDIEDANLTNATAGSAKSVTVLAKSSASFSDDHIKNRDTGLLNADKWSAKGEFAEKDAGARKVTYTLTLSDGAQDNYRIYKKSDFDRLDKGDLTLAEFQSKALARDAGTGSVQLDGEGTIQKANLLVKAAEAQKVYNGNTNTDTVAGGILSKLTIDGVYYDTAKAAVKAGGAYEGTATLNHTPANDEYRAEYRDPNVKPKDGKANAVNYSHIRLVDQADNYNLVYQTTEGVKDLEADTTAGYYKLTGAGKITPLTITDVALNPDFNPSSIRKTYDGTADIPDAMERLRKSGAKVKVKYTEGTTPKEWDITNIDGAYSATGKFKDTGTLLAKDAGKNKNVQFTFSVDKDNFIYAGSSIDKDYNGVGVIDPRKVKLTLQDVQKIYDGTTGVKNGYYEGRGSTLKEHANQDVTLRDLIQVEKAERDDKTGALKNDRGLLGTDGVALDLANLDAKYLDKNANRSPYSPGTKKEVGYKLHLTGDAKAEDNYEFEVYDNNNKAISQANKTADYNAIGHGDIWYKKVEFDLSQLDKEYDGNANLTEKTLKEKLLLKGAVDGENLSLDDTAIKKIKNGSYGDRKADGSFTQNPHVKRRNGSTGEVVARDVRLKGLDEAMASLSDRDVNGAKNYFYNGYVDESGTYVHPEDTVYGKGKITPKTVKLQKTWNGGFEKPYDGTSAAKIKGADGRYYSFGEASTVGEKDSEETKKVKQDVKRAFYDKLHLSVDLGTGEGAIHLGYKLYGDAEGDEPANMPYYANPTTKERDANVHNDGALTSRKKDVVYRLKEVTSGRDYKDWELDPGDMEARLLDGTYKPDGTTEGTSPLGYTATITPRKITVDEKDTAPLAKIYDGTDTVKDLLRVGEKPFDSTHPDFAYQGILETDKGKVKVEATSTDGRFHDRRTDAADKNATLDAKSWEELAKRKDYSEYNTKNESGKVVHYNLALKSVQHPDSPNEAEKIALGNYEVASTYDASAEIVKRKVKVELDAVAPETLTRDYDGSTKAAVRGLHFSPTNDAHTGLVGTEQALLQGGNTRQGVYDTKDVKRDENGVVRKNAHTITYGNLALNDDAVSKNYEIDPANLKTDEAHPEYGRFLQDSGTINPKGLKAELLRQDVQKQYDGTREVKDNAYGTFREGNFRKVLDNEDNKEKNLQEILTKDEKAFHLDANFDSAGASALDANKQSKADKQVTYDISWNNGNYKLLDKDGNDLTQTKADKSGVSFTATVRTQPQSGTIYRRRLQVTASEAQKVYDGTTHVKNAWGNLHFDNVDKDGNVLKDEAKFVSEEEELRAKAIVNAGAAYDNPNATDPTAENPEESDLMNHEVTYSFTGADDVMKNYEILDGSQQNVDVIKGAGKIRRRTLDVLPDWQTTYAGKGGVNFTGRIADGSNGDSPLTVEVQRDLHRFNSGVFTYGPTEGAARYGTPDWQEIQGWYTKNGKKTLARGNYGSNYTLNPVPSRLFVAPRTDGVDRTLRPDDRVYVRASYDENDTFGAYRGLDAALAYTGKGVNTGGTKPQGANAGDAGIGTGTNIGSSASAGGAAGASGKVQGTTSAQPGAAVKPQGTTGGNAALAGGTAGPGGYYRPGAQPGASVKSQGAQQGAAVKPQGAASAAGSLSRTGGAGSVVDRGLAAAAGMSDGSSSGAGVSGRSQSTGYSSGTRSYADGSSRAADRGLANAVGRGSGGAGYYSGKGYSHTDDDEEEEIKKKTKASA